MEESPLVILLVCLANSRKLSGRCVAGKVLKDGVVGSWIRPVSDREHEEISWSERHYSNGSEPAVLDYIQVPVLEARPRHYQTENWLVNANFYWAKLGQVEWKNLPQLLDPPAPLWVNGISSGNGLNDRLPLDQAQVQTSSLRLIHVSEMTLVVNVPGAAFGNPKRQIQAHFRYNQVEYWLRVTDPIMEQTYLAVPDGIHQLGECYLTVSLGEPYGGYCYKLVAAVIQPEVEIL